ncbi:MAG: preprotein translocase subunit SecG [Microgenomates group bacterium]
MKNILLAIQIIVSILFIGAILLQTTGTGFGKAWRGSSSFTRRGLEKLIFKLTFVLAGIFILVSILQIAI